MREYFQERLERLNISLLELGSMCFDQFKDSEELLTKFDKEKAAQVAENEHRLHECRRSIESSCTSLLLLQQPVAGDLRFVTSALKIANDFDRISAQSADLTEIIASAGDLSMHVSKLVKDMSAATEKMLGDCLTALNKRDAQLCGSVIDYDSVVDSLFVAIRDELINKIAADPESGSGCMDIFMIAKYFERIADHAVYVCRTILKML